MQKTICKTLWHHLLRCARGAFPEGVCLLGNGHSVEQQKLMGLSTSPLSSTLPAVLRNHLPPAHPGHFPCLNLGHSFTSASKSSFLSLVFRLFEPQNLIIIFLYCDCCCYFVLFFQSSPFFGNDEKSNEEEKNKMCFSFVDSIS